MRQVFDNPCILLLHFTGERRASEQQLAWSQRCEPGIRKYVSSKPQCCNASTVLGEEHKVKTRRTQRIC